MDVDYPRQTHPNCFPEEQASLLATVPFGATGSAYGDAFTALQIGPPGSGPRIVAVGAPLTLRLGATGSAYLHRMSEGALVAPAQWTLDAPGSASLEYMGHALAPANVVGTHYTAGPATRAEGFELLAGAPGAPGDDVPGQLTWWVSAYPSMADITSPDSYSWSYGGSWRPPSAAIDARFGASVVVDGHDADPSSVEFPEYVVVGAPGEQKVYVLTVDPNPTAANRFSLAVSPIVPAAAEAGLAEDFGQTLLLRDLNGDGWEDLVIGAPQGTSGVSGGYAYVLPGTTAAGGYFDFASRVVIQPTWPSALGHPDDGFGLALAAGPVSGPVGDTESLVIGAPGLDLGIVMDAGGLCVTSFQFDGSTGAPAVLTDLSAICYENPYASLGLVGMEWGGSLAVGNVVPHDAWSSVSTDYGRASELVVGCAGCPLIGVNSAWNWIATTVASGSAFVYGSTDTEPWLLDTCTEEDDQWLTQLLPTSGSGFPSGLALLDAEANGALDLVLLQSGEDQVQLSTQVEVNGIDQPLAGVFAAPTDANGDQDFVLSLQDLGDGTVRLDVMSQFTLSLGEDDGAGGWEYCTGFGLDEEQDLPENEEDLPFSLGAVDAPTPGAGATQVDLVVDDGTDTYTIVADLSFDDLGNSDIWDDYYTLSFTKVKKGVVATAFGNCELIIDGVLSEDVVFSREEGFRCEP